MSADDLGTNDGDGYVSAEAVAERLGISTGILIRRVEAGDIPARRIRTAYGVRYELRLSDLGLDLADFGTAAEGRPPALSPSLPPPPPAPASRRFSAGPTVPPPEALPEPAAPQNLPEPPPSTVPEPPPSAVIEPPPSAVIEPPPSAVTEPPPSAAPQAPPAAAPQPPLGVSSEPTQSAAAEPPSSAAPAEVAVVPHAGNGVLADVPPVSIDPRLLVAGLLDRWERSLEERIHVEERRQFEAELVRRESLVRDLQQELQSVRAEQAAALADRDRAISQRDRLLADRERELVALREAMASRRRGRFFNR